jgi:hypothetical protein
LQANVRKSSYTNLKWAWNESKPKLLAPTASNKNGQKYTKNLEAMIGATKTYLPR